MWGVARIRAQARYEIARIVALVARDGDAMIPGEGLDHHQGGVTLAMAIGRGDAGLHDEPGSMLHQQMPEIPEPRFAAPGFFMEPRVRIGGRAMRGIGAALPVEIDGRIAAPAHRRLLLIARAETFLARPGLRQRAVDSEVIDGEQSRGRGLLEYRLEERRGHVARQQPIAIW